MRTATVANATRWRLGELTKTKPIQVALMMKADCVIDAMGSCDRVGACAGANTMEWGYNNFFRSHCEDNHVMLVLYKGSPDQDTGVIIRLDCSELGLRCIDPPGGSPICAEAGEDVDQAYVTCKGPVATIHESGHVTKVDCSLSNMDCMPGPYASSSPCIGTGDECDDQFTGRCEASELTTCFDGRLATMDCADRWLECSVQDDGGAFCSPPGCYSQRGDVSCSETAITFCGLDGITTVDCTDLGFDGCSSDFFFGSSCTGGWGSR